MAKNEKETVEGQEPLSKEELKKRRVEITTYYKDHIKDLEVQLKYEELLRDIEKTRAERLQAQMFLSQAMAPAPEEGDGSEAGVRAAEALKQAQKDWNAEQATAPPRRTLKRQD